MAVYELEAQGQPQPDEIYVYVEEVDDSLYRLPGKILLEHHVSVNHVYIGLLHLDHSEDGSIAYLDGIDGAEGQDQSLSPQQWDQLVLHLYMHGITQARRIEYPTGLKLFLESVPDPQV